MLEILILPPLSQELLPGYGKYVLHHAEVSSSISKYTVRNAESADFRKVL